MGGGITGAFAAYFSSRLGAKATIIERDEIAAQASGHNAGGLNPLHGPGVPGPMLELALASMRLHLESWDDIRRLSGIDFGGRPASRLQLAFGEAETSELAASAALYSATAGFAARLLSAAELRRAEPRVSPDAVAGLLTEGNARVDAVSYARAVSAAAVKLGATVVSGQACALDHSDGRVTSVRVDSAAIDCDSVVIAPGPWCDAPASWLDTRLPVEPVKGELLLAQPDTPVPATEITWRGFGVYPASGGRVWLGGTEDRAGFDTSATDSARRRILDGIDRLLPGVGSASIVRQVAGLRPMTPDGVPIVGIPVGWENVCLATGAGRKGMLLGAGLGLAASELLLRGGTRLPIGPCDPARPAIQQ